MPQSRGLATSIRPAVITCAPCVQAAVARVLTPPPPDATAEALQMHLKLLAEVFKRTVALAEALQEAVGEGAGVPEMAEAAFTDLLADYPQPELGWLERMHAARPRTVGPCMCF